MYDSAMPLAPETKLGPYRVISTIGKGGMGEVYRAYDERLERYVALKIIPAEMAENPLAVKRFEREAKALASLTHPNIVTIHDIGSIDGVYFVVMELLQGETLRTRIAKGSLHPQEAQLLALCIARGLAAAHSKGVIHRDLKPENILITASGEVKLLDFGLALLQCFDEASSDEKKTISLYTETDSVVGTVPYMSPEQLRGRAVDARSDIFSLGVVLFEMISAKRPFDGATRAETISNIINSEAPSLESVAGKIPSTLSNAIKRCLVKDPNGRFPDVLELLRALETGGAEVTDPVQPRAPESHRRRNAIALTIFLLLCIGGILLFQARAPKETKRSVAVLPFTNSTGDPQAEYLSDGITENLINNLSQIGNLRVIARTTVFALKDSKKKMTEIARELDVETVVTGELQQRGNMLILQVDLIDSSNGSQIWGERYTRTFQDALLLEQEISGEITTALHQKLSGKEEALIGKIHTRNPEAWRSYLQGQYLWRQFTEKSMEESISHYQRALEKDPSYAMAYVGLSEAYGALGTNFREPKEVMPVAKAAALKAIELDPELANAHQALAAVLLFYERDWKETRKELDLALQLNPNLAVAYDIYAFLYEIQGDLKGAEKKLKRAIELDPLSGMFRADYGFLLYAMDRIPESIQTHKQAIEMTPYLVMAEYQLGGVLTYSGNLEEAKRILEEACRKERSAECLGRLGAVYVKSGLDQKAEEVLNEMKQAISDKKIQCFGPALTYVAMGKNEEALFWLNRAVEEHSGWIVWMLIDPVFRPLYNEPQYEQIRKTLRVNESTAGVDSGER